MEQRVPEAEEVLDFIEAIQEEFTEFKESLRERFKSLSGELD